MYEDKCYKKEYINMNDQKQLSVKYVEYHVKFKTMQTIKYIIHKDITPW
jgi:hypothetical protein